MGADFSKVSKQEWFAYCYKNAMEAQTVAELLGSEKGEAWSAIAAEWINLAMAIQSSL